MRTQVHMSHRKALDVVASVLHGLRSLTSQSRTPANDRISDRPSQFTPPKEFKSETQVATYGASSNFDSQRLLSLGVPSLHGLKPADAEDVLDLAVSDRERKMRDVSSRIENSVDQMITTYLNDSSSTQQTLVDALLADTAYHSVEMFDSELRSEINILEAHIGEIGADMANLDLERLKMANQERDYFVNRWTH